MRSCNFFSFCLGALLLSASLALFLPAAASASSLPAATFSNTITLTNGSSQTVPPSSSSPLSDSLGNSGSFTNMYNVPSLSAQATSGLCNCTANVLDTLSYFVEFVGTGSGSISVNVQASVTLFSSSGDYASFNAEVLIGGGSILTLVAPTTGAGASFNGPKTFNENQIYPVFMEVELNPQFGKTGFGSADPIFTPLDAGITVVTSDGIGNNSPVGATPIPAALPLFATGLGGLGLLGWRRKRKAKAVA